MSVVDPSYQEFFDLPDGFTVSVTRFKIAETNNTITVAPPARNSEGAAGCQLLDVNDATAQSYFYVAADGTYDLNNQPAASINKMVTFIAIHPTTNGKE